MRVTVIYAIIATTVFGTLLPITAMGQTDRYQTIGIDQR